MHNLINENSHTVNISIVGHNQIYFQTNVSYPKSLHDQGVISDIHVHGAGDYIKSIVAIITTQNISYNNTVYLSYLTGGSSSG